MHPLTCANRKRAVLSWVCLHRMRRPRLPVHEDMLRPPPPPAALVPAVAHHTTPPRRRIRRRQLLLLVPLLCFLCPLRAQGQLRGGSSNGDPGPDGGPQLLQEDLDIASFLGLDLDGNSDNGESAKAFAAFLNLERSSSSSSSSGNDANAESLESFPGKGTSGYDEGADTLASLLGLADLDSGSSSSSSSSTDADAESPDKSSFFGHATGDSGRGTDSNAKTALNHGPTPKEDDLVYLARAKSIREAPGRDPVIVLNGLGGAGLQFRLRGAKPTHYYCRTWFARYHTAWILPRVMVPPVARCLMDFITPIYDPLTRKFKNKVGVAVKVNGFGQIVSLENLGPSILPLRNFDYIRGFVKFMIAELGYGPGLDLFAAPYDWRYTPDVLKEQGYFRDLKALVETAYVTAGNRRVHIMGHSLGGVVSLAFLNDMPLEWKQTYIKSYIPVGSPFGGTVVNLMGSCSGYNLGLPLAPADLRDFEAQAPTGPWLFPQPSLWSKDEILVQTPNQSYSAHDYERLLRDLGLGEVALPVYKHVAPLYLETLIPPGIDVHVVHSTGNPTVASLIYNQTFNGTMLDIPLPPSLVFGPGDGTVPERSLLRPFYEWTPPTGREGGREGGWVLTHHTMEGVNHMDICNYRGFFRVLSDILSDNVERTLSPESDALETFPDKWKTRMKQTWAPIEAALDAAEEMVFGP